MDKFEVKIAPNADGVVPSNEEMLEKAAAAGWTNDPMDGRTILVDDERGMPGYEVVNPLPIAPPVGWSPTPPIDELIRDRVKEEFDRMMKDEEVDDILDAEDFGEEEEWVQKLDTLYEFMGVESEAPALKEKPVSNEERVKAELDFEELKDKERRFRLRRSKEEYERRRKEEDALYADPVTKE